MVLAGLHHTTINGRGGKPLRKTHDIDEELVIINQRFKLLREIVLILEKLEQLDSEGAEWVLEQLNE